MSNETVYHGSIEWANSLLKLAIHELKNTNRVLFARQQEVFYCLGELERYGFEWQAKRLRNHIHLAIKQGRFTSRRLDSLLKREGASS